MKECVLEEAWQKGAVGRVVSPGLCGQYCHGGADGS